MPLADWITIQTFHTLFEGDAPMPWDEGESKPEVDPEIAAEAEAYLLTHSALR